MVFAKFPFGLVNMSQIFAVALQHHQAGRLPQAEALYRQILAKEPNHAEAWHHLGVFAQQTGQQDRAVQWLRHAATLAPHNPAIHLNLGTALTDQGLPHEAIAEFRQALELQPDAADAWLNLGLALDEVGQPDEAIAAFLRGAELQPSFVPVHLHLARVLRQRARHAEALSAVQRLLVLEPDNAEFHNLLAVTLADLGDFAKSLSAYRRALQCKPDSPKILFNFAKVLRDAGQLEESLASTRAALALDPTLAEAHHNLGNIHTDLRQFDDALAAYDQALACQPDLAAVKFNQAFLYLLRGDFERGWAAYESRWAAFPFAPPTREYGRPRWDGNPVSGRRIFIHAEQGFGDSIQCIRYAALVAGQGGEVVVECPPALVDLLRTAPGVREVVSLRDPLPAFDCVVPIMSLPLLFRTTAETIPRTVPYLFAEAARRESWRQRLRNHPGRLKVGLTWTGNRQQAANFRRLVDPALLVPLLAIDEIDFFSLQILPKSDRSPSFSDPRVIDYTGHIRDFADTAAFIMELDLVITVDTAVAHLAGALGKPVWTLLSFTPDWRWGLEGEHTAWYPTMRLFRQSRLGAWEDVLSQVAEELSSVTREALPPAAVTPSHRT
jgi:Flp pilus assembly protein TadD